MNEAASSPAPGETFRYRLTLAWDGTGYGGWQRQPNADTVQEEVEVALSDLVQAAVVTVGAGRTDAGVHAAGQVVHFDLPRRMETRALVHGANHRLPEAIRGLEAAPARHDFHARYSALAKTYVYRCRRVSRERALAPEERRFALEVPAALDLVALRDATLHLAGRHDFAAFALAGGAHTTSVRTIFAARWEEDGPVLAFRVTGDGFLRGMVRGLVGTLLEVARGRRRVADFAALLAGAGRAAAGPTAPAHGLSLERIAYPPEALLAPDDDAPAGGDRTTGSDADDGGAPPTPVVLSNG